VFFVLFRGSAMLKKKYSTRGRKNKYETLFCGRQQQVECKLKIKLKKFIKNENVHKA
jgi:hypothetical protein